MKKNNNIKLKYFLFPSLVILLTFCNSESIDKKVITFNPKTVTINTHIIYDTLKFNDNTLFTFVENPNSNQEKFIHTKLSSIKSETFHTRLNFPYKLNLNFNNTYLIIIHNDSMIYYNYIDSITFKTRDCYPGICHEISGYYNNGIYMNSDVIILSDSPAPARITK